MKKNSVKLSDVCASKEVINSLMLKLALPQLLKNDEAPSIYDSCSCSGCCEGGCEGGCMGDCMGGCLGCDGACEGYNQ